MSLLQESAFLLTLTTLIETVEVEDSLGVGMVPVGFVDVILIGVGVTELGVSWGRPKARRTFRKTL